MSNTITIDGKSIPYRQGDTIIEAATRAGIYIPHLCHHPEFEPHGSCKVCTVNVSGRNCTACTFPAANGQEVLNDTPELNEERRRITQMLFVEGNHFCPSCEASGNCKLQAVGYFLAMPDFHYPFFYPQRDMDATHPDVLLDRDRCILCALCVRASRDVDRKNVFALSGRGIKTYLIANAPSGMLKDTPVAATDKAMQVCPTGALLVKRRGFKTPIGRRIYDDRKISTVSLEQEMEMEVMQRRGGTEEPLK